MELESMIAAAIGGALIGLAAVMMLATTGRIAGVSGFASRLLPPYADDLFVDRLAFVAGLVAAPIAYGALAGHAVPIEISAPGPLLVAGGLLVGFGAVRGSGCTSGHGVCGIARLSPRSLAATATFMAAGIATVFVMRHIVGG
jgi:uncharacterized membrane protein YedE/YeeE